MRRIAFLPNRPALAIALGLAALPALAMAQQKDATQPAAAATCTRLIAPLERQLKEAQPRLERAGNARDREAVRSRMLFELLKGEEAGKTLAVMLGCLAAQGR